MTSAQKEFMKKNYWYPVIILILFFAVGLVVIKDYGPSADEHIQIDSGHVIWKYLCQKFGRKVPEPIQDVPELHGFKNSFYGQAATFPTVFIEAVKGFTLDSSTIIRIRHYWNFFCYFTGLCCFALMTAHLTGDPRWAAVWLLIQILLPRIFGDIFYNDRDVMLISWMMIFLSSFYLFSQRPGWGTSLLCAAAFGMTANTRIFGLCLLVFPFLYFVFSKNRKYILLFVPASLAFWFLLSPIAWDDPLHAIPNAFFHFSTQQRYIDMGGEAQLLFFGKLYLETKLPWYYIPMYIIVTTPLVTLLFAGAGILSTGGRIFKRKMDQRTLYGVAMLIILIVVPVVGVLFHLTFYNGLRHFYFLFLPITWLSLEGVRLVWETRKQLIRGIVILSLCISFFLTASWIAKAHPYQIIYLSPVFREKWIGKFDRDYWILSTTECMNFLLDYAPDITLNVVDKYAFIEYTIIGLPPQDRERFHTVYHGMQPVPFEYLFFNYSNTSTEDVNFDYYSPVYAVKRDGIKLAEVYRRSHNHEHYGYDYVEDVSATVHPEEAELILDGDYNSSWYGSDEGEFVFHLKDTYKLSGFEIFPAAGAEGFRDPDVFVSSDGVNWTEIESKAAGSNGTSFTEQETQWLKLKSHAKYQGISEILFYGHSAGEEQP